MYCDQLEQGVNRLRGLVAAELNCLTLKGRTIEDDGCWPLVTLRLQDGRIVSVHLDKDEICQDGSYLGGRQYDLGELTIGENMGEEEILRICVKILQNSFSTLELVDKELQEEEQREGLDFAADAAIQERASRGG